MLKYDLMVLRLSILEMFLAVVESTPSFMKYFIKETDLQAIAGRLQEQIFNLDLKIQNLDSMLRELNEK